MSQNPAARYRLTRHERAWLLKEGFQENETTGAWSSPLSVSPGLFRALGTEERRRPKPHRSYRGR